MLSICIQSRGVYASDVPSLRDLLALVAAMFASRTPYVLRGYRPGSSEDTTGDIQADINTSRMDLLCSTLVDGVKDAPRLKQFAVKAQSELIFLGNLSMLG